VCVCRTSVTCELCEGCVVVVCILGKGPRSSSPSPVGSLPLVEDGVDAEKHQCRSGELEEHGWREGTERALE